MKLVNNELFCKVRKKLVEIGDRFSVAAVFLQPLFFGIVFFRVLYMGGAPAWYHVINGILFAGSLTQLIYFISIGILKTLRKEMKRDER